MASAADCVLGYTRVMSKAERTNSKTNHRAAGDSKRPVSPLGRDLRRLSERVVASGVKLLSREEIRREVARLQGASR